MATVYQHDSNGYYMGTDEDYGGAMPNNCVAFEPALQDGFVPRWNGMDWEQVESHKGEKGYIAGQYTEIKDHGPYPEGWTTEYVDPRPENEIRSAEIKARLEGIDRFVIRPMRAMLAGTSTAEDEVILAELENEAESLRAELATLEIGE